MAVVASSFSNCVLGGSPLAHYTLHPMTRSLRVWPISTRTILQEEAMSFLTLLKFSSSAYPDYLHRLTLRHWQNMPWTLYGRCVPLDYHCNAFSCLRLHESPGRLGGRHYCRGEIWWRHNQVKCNYLQYPCFVHADEPSSNPLPFKCSITPRSDLAYSLIQETAPISEVWPLELGQKCHSKTY